MPSLDGLRIDHIDGLRDPLGYLRQLNERICVAITHAAPCQDSPAEDGDRQSRLPIFVEKILARDEELPSNWPATGTTRRS